MPQRLSSWWYHLMSSLWFIPAIVTAAAVALALLAVRIDQAWPTGRRFDSAWLFGGGAEGARGVLTAIASTMITVTATVFSITIVALQLASSQFTPRVLRSFIGDRGNQVVLGAFIGTFSYALLVLRAVRSPSEDGQVFVPSLSVTVAIVLALASIGLLIFYIHHAARSIQASVVIDRAARDTLRLIDGLAPPKEDGTPRPDAADAGPPGRSVDVRAERGGYVQRIDAAALLRLAEERGLRLRLARRVGDFVLPGAALAAVWSPDGPEGDRDGRDPADGAGSPADGDRRLDDRVRAAFVLGAERTLEEDLELGFRQLADIAVKALSPGINDPTTATICIDRLAEALVRFACAEEPSTVGRSQDGTVRLVRPGLAFERAVRVAFGQIRHYGAGDAAVAEHLARALGEAAALVPAVRRSPLAQEARLLLEEARRRLPVAEDGARVQAAGAWATDGAPPRDRAGATVTAGQA